MIIEDAILELTKLLIKEDIREKEYGEESLKLSKKDLIIQNISLLKLIEKYK
jgi:hypothetical protein